jgi:hypothetical protein
MDELRKHWEDSILSFEAAAATGAGGGGGGSEAMAAAACGGGGIGGFGGGGGIVVVGPEGLRPLPPGRAGEEGGLVSGWGRGGCCVFWWGRLGGGGEGGFEVIIWTVTVVATFPS